MFMSNITKNKTSYTKQDTINYFSNLKFERYVLKKVNYSKMLFLVLKTKTFISFTTNLDSIKVEMLVYYIGNWHQVLNSYQIPYLHKKYTQRKYLLLLCIYIICLLGICQVMNGSIFMHIH